MPEETAIQVTRASLLTDQLALQNGILKLEQDLLRARRERIHADAEYTRELTRSLRIENDRATGHQ